MEPQNPQFEQQLKNIHEEAMRKKEHRENSDVEKETNPEKRALHETVGEKLGKNNYAQDDDNQDDIDNDKGEPRSYQAPELRDKVQDLVNTAFEKDIDSAIDEAKKENNPALLDAFHDALVDHLYDHLVERGKLEKL